jgi:hypothetical protein
MSLLHADGCFGVKMSDKLLTFSRHKNKTLDVATLGPASWQEEHQVLAIPANQRTSRSVTVLLSAVWRVFEPRLGQNLSDSLVGVIKMPGRISGDSELFFTGCVRIFCCCGAGIVVFPMSRIYVFFRHTTWNEMKCYGVKLCVSSRLVH